ncbi:hypothetical protein ElyMa_004519800 [Elysia marginata]|uniref:Uncharacterized protein n=1 Tax=Elysia marginata TaxID=1093978 RepID=A0AAV4HQY7_9GAST|nr:hypothetical protein ElyMa_004519800 [Elysia marginata]
MFRPIKTSGRIVTSKGGLDIADDMNNNNNNSNNSRSGSKAGGPYTAATTISTTDRSSISTTTVTNTSNNNNISSNNNNNNNDDDARESSISSSNRNISRLLRSSVSSRTRVLDSDQLVASGSRTMPGSALADDVIDDNTADNDCCGGGDEEDEADDDDDDKTEINDDDDSTDKRGLFGDVKAGYNPFVTDISDFEDEGDKIEENDDDGDDDVIMRLTDGGALYGRCDFDELTIRTSEDAQSERAVPSAWGADVEEAEREREEAQRGDGGGRSGNTVGADDGVGRSGNTVGADDGDGQDGGDVDMSSLDFSSLLMVAGQAADTAASDDATARLSERIRDVHLGR